MLSVMLHVVVGTLPEGAAAEDAPLAAALELGGALAGAPGVRATLLGCSAEHVVAACWLDDRAALEPFAESEPHMAFVMRGLAPLVRGMWSASVTTDAPPIDLTAIAALWALAVPERDGVYEWEVRRLLDSVGALPGLAVTGATVEERERFRAGGIVALRAEEVAPFEAALHTARAGWPAFAAELEAALVPVHPVAAREGRQP
jgi:hypothetical protein